MDLRSPPLWAALRVRGSRRRTLPVGPRRHVKWAAVDFSPESLNGSTARMVLVVDDPDVVFRGAIATGAREVVPLQDQPYGWRVGRVVDPFGHHWEIGKPLR